MFQCKYFKIHYILQISYRGGWSTGINREMAEAADDSVSGALFEKRPYPAPGAILRKNTNP